MPPRSEPRIRAARRITRRCRQSGLLLSGPRHFMSLPVEAAVVSESVGADQPFVIDAARPARWFDWREVWRYRELIWTLASRDIKVRYRQALVGMAWIILQP